MRKHLGAAPTLPPTYPPSQDIEKSPETRRMTREKGKIEERWSLCPLHQSTDEDWGSLEQAGEKEVISCIYIRL